MACHAAIQSLSMLSLDARRSGCFSSGCCVDIDEEQALRKLYGGPCSFSDHLKPQRLDLYKKM